MKRLTATFFALILTICLAAPAAFASETDAEDTGLFEETYFSETEIYSGTSTLPQNAALSTSGVPANENSEYELPVITSAGEVISFPDETETSGTEEERKDESALFPGTCPWPHGRLCSHVFCPPAVRPRERAFKRRRKERHEHGDRL